MNTELDRAAAKSAIIKRERGDTDLEDVLSNAHQYQLGLIREQNRHAEEMRGFFGRIFGNGDNVSLYIAFLGMIVSILIAVGCYIAAFRDVNQVDFWGKAAERAFAFAGTCLAFIFGKSASRG